MSDGGGDEDEPPVDTPGRDVETPDDRDSDPPEDEDSDVDASPADGDSDVDDHDTDVENDGIDEFARDPNRPGRGDGPGPEPDLEPDRRRDGDREFREREDDPEFVWRDDVESERRPGAETEANDVPDPTDAPLRWALQTNEGAVVFLRDALSSVLTVVVIALLLFAISGIWPPLVAVESGSMEPHMYRGDLVFLMDEHRFAPDGAVAGTGVVTHRKGQETGYWSFGDYGNVVVYRPDGGRSTPIIHRARFYVEEGDDWVAMADDAYLGGVDTCAETVTCPAPHDGFITKGDNNGEYDQIGGQSTVVKPSWIKGRAKVRIPWLGYVRLKLAASGPPAQTAIPSTMAEVLASLIARLELAIAALTGIQFARTVN